MPNYRRTRTPGQSVWIQPLPQGPLAPRGEAFKGCPCCSRRSRSLWSDQYYFSPSSSLFAFLDRHNLWGAPSLSLPPPPPCSQWYRTVLVLLQSPRKTLQLLIETSEKNIGINSNTRVETLDPPIDIVHDWSSAAPAWQLAGRGRQQKNANFDRASILQRHRPCGLLRWRSLFWQTPFPQAWGMKKNCRWGNIMHAAFPRK